MHSRDKEVPPQTLTIQSLITNGSRTRGCMLSGCLKIATIELKETIQNPKASRKVSCIRPASTTRLSREAMKLRARQREMMVGDTVALGEEAVAGI